MRSQHYDQIYQRDQAAPRPNCSSKNENPAMSTNPSVPKARYKPVDSTFSQDSETGPHSERHGVQPLPEHNRRQSRYRPSSNVPSDFKDEGCSPAAPRPRRPAEPYRKIGTGKASDRPTKRQEIPGQVVPPIAAPVQEMLVSRHSNIWYTTGRDL